MPCRVLSYLCLHLTDFLLMIRGVEGRASWQSSAQTWASQVRERMTPQRGEQLIFRYSSLVFADSP
jgi:hypothetical protein